MKDSFADTLKQFRTDKKLSQQQLADMLFVERTTIANWETGRRIPDAVLLLRISKCLDIDINILLETIDNTVEEIQPRTSGLYRYRNGQAERT